MTVEEALSFIHGTEKFGSVLGLESIKRLCRALGDPQKGLSYIHVAGTNGKGSVCTMLDAASRAAHHRTGLYTSPALVKFNERIRFNGEAISDEALTEGVALLKAACQRIVEAGHPHPTEFELVTALGFWYFKKCRCDTVVLEVGLGGRLDATNVIDDPRLCVITSLSLDHTDRLGKTLSAIAEEKCGIIKPGAPVVTAPCQKDEALRVIKQRAGVALAIADTPHLTKESLEGIVFDAGELKDVFVPLIGRHQAENAATAICAAREYGFSEEAIREGLSHVVHPARMEIVSRRPLILLDGAHNPGAMQCLKENLEALTKAPRTLICGMLRDKDVEACVHLLAPLFARIITVDVPSPRALSKEELTALFLKKTPHVTPMSLEEAVGAIRPEEVTVIAGSLYMAGEYKARFQRS